MNYNRGTPANVLTMPKHTLKLSPVELAKALDVVAYTAALYKAYPNTTTHSLVAQVLSGTPLTPAQAKRLMRSGTALWGFLRGLMAGIPGELDRRFDQVLRDFTSGKRRPLPTGKQPSLFLDIEQNDPFYWACDQVYALVQTILESLLLLPEGPFFYMLSRLVRNDGYGVRVPRFLGTSSEEMHAVFSHSPERLLKDMFEHNFLNEQCTGLAKVALQRMRGFQVALVNTFMYHPHAVLRTYTRYEPYGFLDRTHAY